MSQFCTLQSAIRRTALFAAASAFRGNARVTAGPGLRHRRRCRSSGEFVGLQACRAALRFHDGEQLSGEVVERLVAGEQEHMRAGDRSAGGRVAIKIDDGKVNGDDELSAAGDLENRKSDRFLVIQATGEGWRRSARQRIDSDGLGEGTEIVVVEYPRAAPANGGTDADTSISPMPAEPSGDR